jgi:hypothetical protein
MTSDPRRASAPSSGLHGGHGAIRRPTGHVPTGNALAVGSSSQRFVWRAIQSGSDHQSIYRDRLITERGWTWRPSTSMKRTTRPPVHNR